MLWQGKAFLVEYVYGGVNHSAACLAGHDCRDINNNITFLNIPHAISMVAWIE